MPVQGGERLVRRANGRFADPRLGESGDEPSHLAMLREFAALVDLQRNVGSSSPSCRVLSSAAFKRLGRTTVAASLVLTLCLVVSGCGHTSVGVGAGYQPGALPLHFSVTFALRPNGDIAVGGSIGVVTEVGVFSVEANVETNVQPGAGKTLVIIRHHVKRGVFDSVYRIGAGEVIVTLNGRTKVRISDSKVFIDALKGKVESIVVKNGPHARPARTVIVPAKTEGGVSTGVYLTIGNTYNISGTGSARYGYDSVPCTGYPTTQPDGSRYLGTQNCGPKQDPSATLPSAPIGLLIWRIGNGPWEPAPASFTATTAGPLYLAFNDVPGEYGDNAGFYTAIVCVSPGC